MQTNARPAPLAADQLVEPFRRALLIRRVEEQVAEMIGVDFPGSTHFYIGQELTAVAACAALEPDDWVFTTHRNRGHVLARGGDPGRLLLELLGKEGGYARGKAGSFHIADPDLNMPVASAMVAGSLPVAVGAAPGGQPGRGGGGAAPCICAGAPRAGGGRARAAAWPCAA